MEINNSQIEIGKGFRLHDFYYYLLLSDFTISQLKTEIKKNKWWFNKLEIKAQDQFIKKIKNWEDLNK